MTTQETRSGKVKWFDFSKKFGFVTLENEEDAMLHISCLQNFKVTEVPKGSAITCTVESTKKGLSVKRVISLQPPESHVNGDNYVPAQVKWFDMAKGYGFVTRGEDTVDVFVHVVTVKANDIVELKPGQDVMIVVQDSRNGPKAASIKAV